MENHLWHRISDSLEFSSMNLGIVTDRNPQGFEQSFIDMYRNYSFFKSKVEEFRSNLSWDNMAKQHLFIYKTILNYDKSVESPQAAEII